MGPHVYSDVESSCVKELLEHTEAVGSLQKRVIEDSDEAHISSSVVAVMRGKKNDWTPGEISYRGGGRRIRTASHTAG